MQRIITLILMAMFAGNSLVIIVSTMAFLSGQEGAFDFLYWNSCCRIFLSSTSLFLIRRFSLLRLNGDKKSAMRQRLSVMCLVNVIFMANFVSVRIAVHVKRFLNYYCESLSILI